jgi:hypothetical protein
VTDELPHNKYGHLDIVGNGALLKRAGVTIFIQIDQQLLILLNPFARAFVGNSRRFNDPKIRSKMVDVADVSLAQNGNCMTRFHESCRKGGESGSAQRKTTSY